MDGIDIPKNEVIHIDNFQSSIFRHIKQVKKTLRTLTSSWIFHIKFFFGRQFAEFYSWKKTLGFISCLRISTVWVFQNVVTVVISSKLKIVFLQPALLLPLVYQTTPRVFCPKILKIVIIFFVDCIENLNSQNYPNLHLVMFSLIFISLFFENTVSCIIASIKISINKLLYVDVLSGTLFSFSILDWWAW